jgi:hypothetical protein
MARAIKNNEVFDKLIADYQNEAKQTILEKKRKHKEVSKDDEIDTVVVENGTESVFADDTSTAATINKRGVMLKCSIPTCRRKGPPDCIRL